MAMIVSLQRQLKIGSDKDQEQQFFAHTLQYLTTCSGHWIEMEDWMITSYKVEFGHGIGSSGLYAFFFVVDKCVPAEPALSVDGCSKAVGIR